MDNANEPSNDERQQPQPKLQPQLQSQSQPELQPEPRPSNGESPDKTCSNIFSAASYKIHNIWNHQKNDIEQSLDESKTS